MVDCKGLKGRAAPVIDGYTKSRCKVLSFHLRNKRNVACLPESGRFFFFVFSVFSWNPQKLVTVILFLFQRRLGEIGVEKNRYLDVLFLILILVS